MFLGHSVMLSSVAEPADLVTLVIKFKYQKTPQTFTHQFISLQLDFTPFSVQSPVPHLQWLNS